jgi:hypothetical protein
VIVERNKDGPLPYLDNDKSASFTSHKAVNGARIYVPFNIGALNIPLLVVLPTTPRVPSTSSGLVSTFPPAIMTNFHDPKVVQADASAPPYFRHLSGIF